MSRLFILRAAYRHASSRCNWPLQTTVMDSLERTQLGTQHIRALSSNRHSSPNDVCMPPKSNEFEGMSKEEFRRNAHQMVDFVIDYQESLAKVQVRSQVEPGYLRGLIPSAPPTHPEPWTSIMSDVNTKILPGITHWQSPNFFAYYPANTSRPALLGDLLSSSLGVIGFSWITSPACTELETIVMDWLHHMLQLPKAFHSSGKGGGVIQGSASEAVLVAVLAAKMRAIRRLSTNDHHQAVAKLVGYCSDQAHSSVIKAFRLAGFTSAQLRILNTRFAEDHALSPAVLKTAIDEDISAGRTPFFVCATLGTTSSCAFDPINELGEVVRAHQLWMHVDAAYAGNAFICPEFRPLLDGVEHAESFNFNAHKWMLVPFDCSPMWIRDRSLLLDALAIQPEYLRNRQSEAGLVVDYKDWQIPLGRRFRSLKLWMVLRTYGVEKLQAYIRHHVALAKCFETWLLTEGSGLFQVLARRTLSLVCFRCVPPHSYGWGVAEINTFNQKILDRINESGNLFLSHTKLDEKLILRLAIGAPSTQEIHVRQAFERIRAVALSLLPP